MLAERREVLQLVCTANFANWSSASSPDRIFPWTNLLTKSFQTDKASASEKLPRPFLREISRLERGGRGGAWTKWVTFFQFISHKPLLTPTQCDTYHNIEIYKKVLVIQLVGWKYNNMCKIMFDQSLFTWSTHWPLHWSTNVTKYLLSSLCCVAVSCFNVKLVDFERGNISRIYCWRTFMLGNLFPPQAAQWRKIFIFLQTRACCIISVQLEVYELRVGLILLRIVLMLNLVVPIQPSLLHS